MRLRRVFLVIVGLLLICTLSACRKKSQITKIYSDPDLSLDIIDIADTQLTIEITNKKAGSEVTTGNGTHFVLERNVNSVWYQMPENDVSRTYEGWICRYNEPLTQKVELSLSYRLLRSGHYRLLKEVYVDGIFCWLCAEFDLD